MKTASWVIVDRTTGKAVFETFSARLLPYLNTDKYEAVPILTWLQRLNKQTNKGVAR